MKNKIRINYAIIIGILILLSGTGVSRAEDGFPENSGKLIAALNRDSARVGETVTLTLSYNLPEGVVFSRDPEIKGLEDFTLTDIHRENGRIKVKILVDRMDSWKTGSLSIIFFGKEGKTTVFSSDPVSLEVISNLEEEPAEVKLRPIEGIIPIESRWLKYLPWGAMIAGILLILFGLWWWYRKIKNSRLSAVNRVPLHIRVKEEIEELEGRGLFEKGYIKEFYFRFSEILRHYLEDLRGFPAAEFTTEEIAIRIDNKSDRALIPLLRQADLVKFADTIPSPAGKEEEIKAAITYIEETSPVLEPNLTKKDDSGVGV